MKIVHINLRDQFNDEWSYQDNLLPRMHKRAGHKVTLITTCRTYNGEGIIVSIPPKRYVLPDGVQVIRILEENHFLTKRLQALLTPYKIYDLLVELEPDLIMVHGMTIRYANRDLLRYIKKVNPRCVVVTDSHTCEINSTVHECIGVKEKLLAAFVNRMRKQLYPYSKKIFAITPACCEYAVKYYKAPAQKVELLPLGYDPDVLPWEHREAERKSFREKYGFSQDDFLIVHGGKIIKRRKTPETIEAVMKLGDPRVKLVIFGGMDAEMKPQVEPLLEKYKDQVLYLGSLTPQEYHKAYYASDLALFPGGQSVLWQQAIGCGLPIAVGNDKNLDYLNRGGNAAFIDDTTVDGIYKKLVEILDVNYYSSMKSAAQEEGRYFFSYERIAKMVTDCVE